MGVKNGNFAVPPEEAARNLRQGSAYYSDVILYQEAKMTRATRKLHWALWPFVALWRLLATIVEMIGRLVAILIGLVLMLVGFLVSLTIVGAIIGIPLFIVGLLLTLKGIF